MYDYIAYKNNSLDFYLGKFLVFDDELHVVWIIWWEE